MVHVLSNVDNDEHFCKFWTTLKAGWLLECGPIYYYLIKISK